MLRYGLVGLLVASAPGPVAAQTPNWQELALKAQQNATLQGMIDNGIITALQNENAQLREELRKAQKAPGDPPSTKEPNR